MAGSNLGRSVLCANHGAALGASRVEPVVTERFARINLGAPLLITARAAQVPGEIGDGRPHRQPLP